MGQRHKPRIEALIVMIGDGFNYSIVNLFPNHLCA